MYTLRWIGLRLVRGVVDERPDRAGFLQPKVYLRITDNWLEFSLRFVVPSSGVRHIKNDLSRDILDDFDAAGIGIGSAIYDIVGLPPITLNPATPEPPNQ